MKNSKVISRKGVVNHKWLSKLPADEYGMVDIPNVIHVAWDNGDAYVACGENMAAAVKVAATSTNPKLVSAVVKRLGKLCKAKGYEELFFSRRPGMTFERTSFKTLKEVKVFDTDPNSLGYFNSEMNQVDKLFNDPKVFIAGMVDNSGHYHTMSK